MTSGVDRMDLITQSAPETCPNCGRLHQGERVEVLGGDRTPHWTGCMACWSSLTALLPAAFELASTLRSVLNSWSYDPVPMRRTLARWDDEVARIALKASTKD